MRTDTNRYDCRYSSIAAIYKLLTAFFFLVTCVHVGLSQTPTTAEGYVEAGIKLVQVGHLDNAVAFFSKAIELKPELADAFNNRGFVYHKQGKSQLALSDFTKAIQLQPNNALYYKNRAFVYSTVNFYQALVDYKSALKLDPTDALTWNTLGALRVRHGTSSDYLYAIDDFTEAIKLKPDFVEAYISRGASYRKSFKHDQAMADLNKAIQLSPRNANAYRERSDNYRVQYKYDLAIADMTQAIGLQPLNASYYQNRGWLYLHQAGVERIEKIAKARSIDRPVIELAIADFTKAMQLQPAGHTPYINRAIAYCALGEKALSDADYNKAIEVGAKYLTKCP